VELLKDVMPAGDGRSFACRGGLFERCPCNALHGGKERRYSRFVLTEELDGLQTAKDVTGEELFGLVDRIQQFVAVGAGEQRR
jgi:hypothetical protein